MTILWTDKTAAEATGGKAQGKWQASRVEIDSRRIQPGDLFVALKGENFDGHDYVADALRKGAVAAMVDKHHASLPQAGGNFLIIEDTFKALEDLGIHARKHNKAKVIGVTGSVGKTSTKEMIRLALAAHGKTYASTGNFNNHIGTPLNLANLPPDAMFTVFEMGMNHAGEIAHLTKMVKPDVAVITNVEAVHMEFFDSIEAIAQAKAEIFEGITEDGVAVLGRDGSQYDLLAECARRHGITRIATFGGDEADCRLLDYRATPDGSAISAVIYGKSVRYKLKAVGRHWALASLLTLAVSHSLGLDDAKTASALAGFSELEGRGSVMRVGETVLVDDSYNASPAAMRAAFAKVAEVWESNGRMGRKLAALGNMLELGPEAPKLHAALAAELEHHGFDGVFTAGELMKHLHDALPEAMRAGHVAEAKQLLPLLRKELRTGDVLLVKGSHGSKMYELAEALQMTVEGTGKKKHAV